MQKTVTANKELSRSNLNTEIISFEQEGKVEDQDKDENEIENEPSKQNIDIEIISKHKFDPFGAHVYSNILASKQLITDLYGRIIEYFPNDLDLYCYVDISTALQINDQQINVFKILMERDKENDEVKTVAIANCDLHSNTENNANLYAVIIPNNYPGKSSCNDEEKWKWKFSEFLFKEEIFNKYGIPFNDLPKSSRKMISFSKQLNQQLIITDHEDLIDNTDWFAIDQIESAQRKFRKFCRPNINISLSKSMWITECKKSFTNAKKPLIPIVINKRNKHWIEWVKIIDIKSKNVSIGIALEYNEDENKCIVKSILLDRAVILNKFRLIGFNKVESTKYLEQLSNVTNSISRIEWMDTMSPTKKKKIPFRRASIKRPRAIRLMDAENDTESLKTKPTAPQQTQTDHQRFMEEKDEFIVDEQQQMQQRDDNLYRDGHKLIKRVNQYFADFAQHQTNMTLLHILIMVIPKIGVWIGIFVALLIIVNAFITWNDDEDDDDANGNEEYDSDSDEDSIESLESGSLLSVQSDWSSDSE